MFGIPTQLYPWNAVTGAQSTAEIVNRNKRAGIKDTIQRIIIQSIFLRCDEANGVKLITAAILRNDE